MRTRTSCLAVLLASSAFVLPASAADPVRGKALYQNTQSTGAILACAQGGCHGPDPTANMNNVRAGASAAVILSAINGDVGGMGLFKPYILATEAADIAAYIANPAAGTATPAVALTTGTLAFGNQVLGTASATMSAKLTNSGTANLVLSSIAVTPATVTDFKRGGTCVAPLTLAPAQSCTIDVVFTPAALGARAAAVTVGHNASPATSTIGLSGTGVSAPSAGVALSATTLPFGNQTLGTPSAARTVSISNTGTAPLALGTITTIGSHPADFAATGCSGVSLLPNTSCTVSVTFKPSALNARSATLNVPSNATGSPHGVALTGNGTAAPAPAVTLTPPSLAFGNQTTGTTSAMKTITLANSGNAALSITSIASTAPAFVTSHTCPASLAGGASCAINVTFAPTSVAPYAGAVNLTTNAAGGPHAVALSGSGAAPTPTAPIATLSPLSLDFGLLPLNTTSAPRTVTLSNTGNAPLAITSVTLGGLNLADFSQSSSTCPAGSTLAAGATCSISVRFAPTTTGPRAATLVLASNAGGSPSVELKGTGVVQASATAQVMPSQVVFRSTRLGKSSDERTVRVRNSGSTPLVISSVTISGDFAQENDCVKTLAPGKACEVKVRFKPAAAGTRVGELGVSSNATGSPHVVKLSGLAVTRQDRDDDDDCDDESSCSQSLLPFFRRSR